MKRKRIGREGVKGIIGRRRKENRVCLGGGGVRDNRQGLMDLSGRSALLMK